jgi:hypothetical protein
MASKDNGLEESLDSFVAGCRDVGLDPENDVRGHIGKLFEKSFDLNKKNWEEKGALVLAAARFAGRYAAAYAHMKNSGKVKKTHANRGLAEAKELCTARRLDAPPDFGPRREWCKDVQIPSEAIDSEPL